MKIAYSIYELVSRSMLKKRSGALLKIHFDDGLEGYADCHPWEELGDKSLAEQLKLLAGGKTTALTERSLYFARIDAEARDKKTNLFYGLKIPASHYLIQFLEQWKTRDVEAIHRQGFAHVKVKLGSDLKRQTIKLLALMLYLRPHIKVRLDFNSQLNPASFDLFLKNLGNNRQRVDFFEDPFKFDADEWKKFQSTYQIDLACDHQSQQAIDCPQAAKVLVIKPAIQPLEPFKKIKSQRLVITSYLDHPIGQLCAAYMAAQIAGADECCGLASHFAYQSTQFSEQLQMSQNTLRPPPGNGLGFDDLLKNLRWNVI
jgi:o-succinylbenzoate synthase